MAMQRPSELTREFHAQFLQSLRTALETVVGRDEALRVRDWDFAIVDGTPTVQVFLDKGHDDTGRPRAVSLDESVAVHRAWMEGPLFDAFADGIAIEVGSAGAEPPCREAGDFSVLVGREAVVELWHALDAKRKFSGIIEAVSSEEGVVVLRDAAGSVALPLTEVRRATVDLLKTPSAAKGRRSPKGRTGG